MYLFICDLAWYKNYGGLRLSRLNRKKTLLTSEEIKEKLINKGIPFEEYKDERGVF